jgi:hypothetical protein
MSQTDAAIPTPQESPQDIDDLAGPVIQRVLFNDPEYQHYLKISPTVATGMAEWVFGSMTGPHQPEEIYDKLRWGGQFVFVSRNRRETHQLADRFARAGFLIERKPALVRLGMRLPLFSPKIHYFVARKTLLIQPGKITDRFTYQVQLVHEPGPDGPLIVLKEVPTVESVVARLRKKFPDVGVDYLEKRAVKFTERIFPTFLTREAAILMILQDHLPEPYRKRVPRVIDAEKDDRGMVRRLRMTWLRNGGRPLPHLEFARQSADLLRAIHDHAHVIHLDLRLDNFVITEEGVGFVDFGSSVRDDEDLSQNPMLSSLFDELMRTSQIQKMLEKMTLSGQVTSPIISRGVGKVDKSVDFFYLAVQFNSPHSNPELAGLIDYDPAGRDARDLARLTEDVLRPADPANSTFRSAKDILHGIERIQLRLDDRHKRPVHD